MEETLDAVNDDEELEEEADAEVDKVLYELTDGKLGQAGKVGADLPVSYGLSACHSTGSVRDPADLVRHRKRTNRKTK